jgi:hypothetical protein
VLLAELREKITGRKTVSESKQEPAAILPGNGWHVSWDDCTSPVLCWLLLDGEILPVARRGNRLVILDPGDCGIVDRALIAMAGETRDVE